MDCFKNILVTGGAGFIGCNFILYLLDKYCGAKSSPVPGRAEAIRIINVDCLTYAGNLESLKQAEKSPHYEFIKADVRDSDTVSAIFERTCPDLVVHFAAESHVDRSIKNPGVFVETNVLGTVSLLDAANKFWREGGGYRKNKKFIQVSTDEVYGSLPETGLFTEETPLSPRSPYSASKAAADMLAMAYFETYGLPVNITRCSNNYGPYQFPEKLIPLMLNNALTGKKLPVYGDGRNVRDWLYVTDHAKAIEAVAEKGVIGEVYNIGGNNEMQNIEIVNLLIETLIKLLPPTDPRRGHINKGLIEYVKDRLGHDRRYAIDASKIEKELGWHPETKFDKGIERTVKWYLDNSEWVSGVTSGDYMKYYDEMYFKG